MLNTFENSTRHHLRRKERERHLRAMEEVSKRLDCHDESALFSMVDSLSGFPLEKEDTSTEPYSPRKRSKWQRQWRLKVCAILLAILAVVFVVFRLGINFGKDDTAEPGKEWSEQESGNESRHKQLFSLVLDWGVTPRQVLEDPRSAPGQAFQWLAGQDVPAENFETVRTRYALATLYFGTNHLRDNSSHTPWKESQHWLSSYTVCTWHGVECLDDRTTIGLVKELNLSANGLVGTLPDEIGLLGLDIRSLDLSNNAILGTIPTTLSTMQNLGKDSCRGCVPSSTASLTQ